MKAFVFDLFHTLVDVATAPGSRGRYTADILGVGRREWHAACFSDAHDICRPTSHYEVVRTLAHRIDPDIPEARIRQAVEERQQRFDHALLNVEDETLRVLGNLRGRGLRLGLISNASSGEVAAWDDSPLARHFDRAVFSCECGMKKPEPAIYHHTLEALGVSPDESFFVGDGGSREHVGARAVGMRTVMITRFIDERTRRERAEGVQMEVCGISQLLVLG
jgi:putative hydrolase of the HAD superfamily